MAGISSVTANGSLVNKLLFPREVLPIASVFANLVNFLLSLLVLFVALLIFQPQISPWIVLLPVVAGIAYEIIRYAGRHVGEQALVSAIVLPGMWLQKLTTRQPDDSQIEVAIAALQAVLPEQEPTVKEKENEPAAG